MVCLNKIKDLKVLFTLFECLFFLIFCDNCARKFCAHS